MKIQNKQQISTQKLQEAKEVRLDQVQESLDERSVQLQNLTPEQRAENSSYGAKMLGDIDEVQSSAPKDGVKDTKSTEAQSAESGAAEESKKTETGETEQSKSKDPLSNIFGDDMLNDPNFPNMLLALLAMESMMIMLLLMLLMQGGGDPSQWTDGDVDGIDEVDGGGGADGTDGTGGTEETGEEDGTDGTGDVDDPNSNNDKKPKMTPVRAASILEKYFDLLDTAAGIGKKDGIIGKQDLEAAAKNPDAPQELKDAVNYLLKNPMMLNALDVGSGVGEVDGKISKGDLKKFVEDHKGKEGYDLPTVDDKTSVDGKDATDKTEGTDETDKTDGDGGAEEVDDTPTPEKNALKIQAQADAARLSEAMQGAGTDEKAISGILAKRNPEQIAALKDAYKEMNGTSLENAIKSETSGDLQKLLLALLSGNRASESTPVDPAAVNSDVQALNKAVRGLGTDENKLIEVLSSRSKKHLAEVSKKYKEVHGESLSGAIKGDTSGAFETALLQILSNAENSQP